MGTILASPYTRTVLWHDPRDSLTSGVSRDMYMQWRDGRNKQAENVGFRTSCVAGVYALMQDHCQRGSNGLDRVAFHLCMSRLAVDPQVHDVLFTRFDCDNDGLVDVQEFCQLVDEYINGQHNYMLLQSCFRLFDLTNTGKVTQEELETLLHKRAAQNRAKDAKQREREKLPRDGANDNDHGSSRDIPLGEVLLATDEQILTMMRLTKHQGAGAATVSSAMVTFNDFLIHCSQNSTLLAPFMNHILRLMCVELGRGLVER